MSKFLGGVAAANQTIANDRQAAQVELANLIEGFEKNENGKYEPNAKGQNMLDHKDALMQQQLMKLEAQNEAIMATQNADSMTRATTALAMGDVKEAWNIVSQNPALKAQLGEQFGAASIQPIDWANDRDMFEGTGVQINDETLSKPEVLNALNSSFFKVIGPDGKATLGNTQQLIAETNYGGYASKEDREGIFERVNKISEILSGHIKTQEELELEATNAQIAQSNANINADVTALKEEYIEGIIASDMSAEEKLAKISGAKGRSVDELKALAEESKTRIQLATENDKIEKAKAEAATAKGKAEAFEPIPGEAEFIASLRDAEKVPYNDDNLRKAGRIQGKKAITAERSKEVNGRFAMAKSFHNFTNKFIDTELNRDALGKIQTTLDKLMKPGMTGQEQEKVLNNIEIDTELRALISEYVKFMSGAAVTTEEYNRYNDIAQAGAWSSKESAVEALRSFTNYLRVSSKDRIDSIVDLPRDYLIKRQDYNRWAAENPAITREASRKTTEPPKKSTFNKYKRSYR